MRIHCRGIGVGSCVAALVAVAGAVDAAMFSLKAVRINPECVGGANAGEFCTKDDECDSLACSGAITPTNEIEAGAGDVIVCEVYGADWSPSAEQLAGYGAAIDTHGFYSGPIGDIRPLGSNWILLYMPCVSDEECNDIKEGYICTGWDCYGPYPERGIFIDTDRDDHVFAGRSYSRNVDFFDYILWSVVYGATGVAYTQPAKYCGTLVLVVSEDACGTFTITFLRDDWWTCMVDTNGSTILPLEFEPLAIHVPGDCPWPHIIATDPPNCAIDARQPSAPDGSNSAGWTQIHLTFDGPLYRTNREHFLLTTPINWYSWFIPSFNAGTYSYHPRPPSGHWTCLTYLPTNEQVCITSLPGDVDGNERSNPRDILALIDHLNGKADPPLEIWQCDVDRSGVCAPPDILRVIDLLNGAGVYEPWLNRTLPPCPTAP